MTDQQVGEFNNGVESSSAAANVGKKFYDWYTLGTFSGAAFLASAIWQILKQLQIGGLEFTHTGWPLLVTALVVFSFAVASEPWDQPTKIHQKVQKALISIANTLLVYTAVIGATEVISG